jgi:hypothetical protein
MMEVEPTEPLPAVSYDGQHRRVWILGRLHGEPVGTCIVQLNDEGLSPGRFGALTAARYMRGAEATGTAAPQDLPATYKRCIRRGMLAGPVAYVRSVRTQARAAAAEVRP